MVPPIYRDAGGRPIQHASASLTKNQIHQALELMASHLQQHGVMVNAVAVGGAVNTMYLKSRQTTHDVDFFLRNPSAPEHNMIHQAARHANRQLGGSLGADWFNNTTQIMMGRRVQEDLATAAFKQNTIIFQSGDQKGGLRIYAAPWSYAFCGKLNRLCEERPRPYDLADAVVYLHEHLRSRNRQSVSAKEVYGWCKAYGKKVTEIVLRRVEEAYYNQYGRRAIEWDLRP